MHRLANDDLDHAGRLFEKSKQKINSSASTVGVRPADGDLWHKERVWQKERLDDAWERLYQMAKPV